MAAEFQTGQHVRVYVIQCSEDVENQAQPSYTAVETVLGTVQGAEMAELIGDCNEGDLIVTDVASQELPVKMYQGHAIRTYSKVGDVPGVYEEHAHGGFWARVILCPAPPYTLTRRT